MFRIFKYNKFPAKIFISNNRSLSIGAILGSIALLTNSIFTLSIFSGIFLIKSLSVIVQVGFLKLRKIISQWETYIFNGTAASPF